MAPYRPTCLVNDRDPRGRPRQPGYMTYDDSSSRVSVANGEEDVRREQLRRLVTDPKAQNVLFVNAVVKRGRCYRFAAATTTTFIDVDGGLPYNILTETTDQQPTEPQHWRCSSVRPRDIVRFVVNNMSTPVTIVGCDFDQLLTTTDRSFCDDFCRFTKLPKETLSETDGEELCGICFPLERRRGDFVTSDGLFLYCLEHARTVMQYGADLLLYIPTTVSMCINDTRLWLSVVERTAGDERSSPLTYRDLPKTDARCQDLAFDDGELLMRKVRAYATPLKRCGEYTPSNTVRAMQYICASMLAHKPLCQKTEYMGPPSLVKVHRM